MSETIRIQDLSVSEIRIALEETGFERRHAVEQFVDEIGGLENALLAIQMLYHLEEAA